MNFDSKLIRWSAVLMFLMIGGAALRVWLTYYSVGFENIADYKSFATPEKMLLLTAVCWGTALALALRKRRPPCAAL